jgi:hypothetical protein
MGYRMNTQTFAILEISPEAYAEIRSKLQAIETPSLGVSRIHSGSGSRLPYPYLSYEGDLIDMHGLALAAPPQAATLQPKSSGGLPKKKKKAHA